MPAPHSLAHAEHNGGWPAWSKAEDAGWRASHRDRGCHAAAIPSPLVVVSFFSSHLLERGGRLGGRALGVNGGDSGRGGGGHGLGNACV